MHNRLAALVAVFIMFAGYTASEHRAQAHSLHSYERATGISCGRERWGAKTLSDGTQLLPQLRSATVAQLRDLPRPYGVDGMDAPRVPAERQVYRVPVEVLGYKLEDDGDIHIVIAMPGDRAQTMVAEIPNAGSPDSGPGCMAGASPEAINAVRQARLAFVRAFGIPPVTHFAIAYREATIVGPIFFDFAHDQDGMAPNVAEVHPVIGFSFAGGAATSVIPSTSAQSARRSSANSSCVKVWVNTRSGIYHLQGSRWYGHTREGRFMCQSDADRAGYRQSRSD